MTKYSVKELAQLAKVSVRTLHHYDQIDLLKPAYRSDKGYRFYERRQLLLLQQILFYRELGFSLKDIRAIVTDPAFDLIRALESHRAQLRKQSEHLFRLMQTIDKTLNELKNKQMMKDSEIYEGFTVNQTTAIKEEVDKRWGKDERQATEERIKSMGKDGWADTKQEAEQINQLLAELMDKEPSDTKVQEAIAWHYKHMNRFYEVSKERYLGLGRMYVEDERFSQYYEQYREGLAQFIQAAIEVYCENNL